VRLKKLKIFGFKSFAQKSELLFEGNGLTAIVGPNGCGKSNVTEAIRWAMGERAGNLRSDNQQELIFSGAAARSAMNIAEVSILIENDRGLLPAEYSEVMIMRRVRRDGGTEYSLNGQECRQKDILTLFLGTGLGAGSYSYMEKEMIDQLLSDRADDRRKLFEEAAGVSKYKSDRKAALSQLERIRESMERVGEDLQRTKDQMRRQEKLLEKAREKQRLEARKRELDLSMASAQYAANKEALKTITVRKGELEMESEREKVRQTELEGKIAERQLAISGEQEALREIEGVTQEHALRVKELESESLRLRERERMLLGNQEKAEKEMESAGEQQRQFENEKSEIEDELQEKLSELDELEREHERSEETLQILRDRTDELREEEREVSGQRLNAQNAWHTLQNKFSKADAESELLEASIQKAEAELVNLKVQKEELQKTITETTDRGLAAQRKHDAAAEQVSAFGAQKSAHEEVLQAKNAELRDLQKQATQAESRRASLQALERSLEGAGAGTKALLEKYGNAGATLLSASVQVKDAKNAPLVEFCLGACLGAVCAPSEEAAVEWFGDLQNAGMVGFGTHGDAMCGDSVAEFIEPHPVATSILQNYFLVPDLETARKNASLHPGENLWFVTPALEAVSSCGILQKGGATESDASPLRRKAEIEELNLKVNELNLKIKSVEAEIAHTNGLLQESTLQLQSATDDARESEREAQAASSELAVAKTRLQSTEDRMASHEASRTQAQERITQAIALRTGDSAITEAQELAEKLEAQYQKVSANRAEQEMVLRGKNDDFKELSESLRTLQNGLSAKKSRLDFLRNRLSDLSATLSQRESETEQIDAELKILTEQIEGADAKVETANEQLATLEGRRDEARERFAVVSGDLEEWRSDVRQMGKNLLERAHDISQAELRVQGLENSLQNLRERIFEEYEFNLDSPPESSAFTPVEFEEREAKAELAQIATRIKEIGPVSVDAAEDFEREKAAYEEWQKQFDDLERTHKSLDLTMTRLDGIARDRFLDTFRKIQANFQDVFNTIMPGGKSMLSLAEFDEEGHPLDPLEAPININAEPPGKKMRGMAALSNGERTLTATSLLFALYMVRPAPYCILDEVDGPLDDANVGRFVGLLRRFSKQTQFIVVTHNKITMAAVDFLYGVTQEIKGISKIGSVKIEEAVGFAG
jgi:chromosome segregation protein